MASMIMHTSILKNFLEWSWHLFYWILRSTGGPLHKKFCVLGSSRKVNNFFNQAYRIRVEAGFWEKTVFDENFAVFGIFKSKVSFTVILATELRKKLTFWGTKNITNPILLVRALCILLLCTYLYVQYYIPQ